MNEVREARVTRKLPNIFKDKPEVGTILATMTQTELAAHQRVWEETQAADLACDVPFSQAMDVVENKNKFWQGICKKYDIPYAWGISVDPITGDIYISE